MKQITYLLIIVVLASCSQSNSEQKTQTVTGTTTTEMNANVKPTNVEPDKDEDYDKKGSLIGFEKATLYKLTDTISADFDGDGNIDKAFYKKENETSGVVIIHGKTNKLFRIGFGKSFAHLTEFDWVDYWGLVEDSITSENTFTEEGDVLGSKEVKLQNPSIALGADEVGGGLITFLNGKYMWIHQTC